MCLYIDEKLTKKGLKGRRVHPNGMVKVWKVLINKWKTLRSPYLSINYTWKPGWNKSNRKSKKLTKNEKEIGFVNKGIHVFLIRKDARNYCRFFDVGFFDVVVPVYVYKKDLIACGESSYGDEAVFTKVFLKKEDYNKALKFK